MQSVLSNREKINGAAALFYPGVMEKIAEQLHGDFLVLPSSVHECLILPDNGNRSLEQLKEMVQEVNANELAPDDVLTEQVYSYDAKDKIFERADRKEERLATKFKMMEQKPSIMDKLKESKGDIEKNAKIEIPIMKKEAEIEI